MDSTFLIFSTTGFCISNLVRRIAIADPFDTVQNVRVQSDSLMIFVVLPPHCYFLPSGSTTALKVYGQQGSFFTNTPNNGGIVSSSTLNNPISISLDSREGLWVADQGNHRVSAL